jgi:transposase-like protein
MCPAAERLDHHLEGGEPDGRANSRNGYGAKTVLTGSGKLDLQAPRDRLATFDPRSSPSISAGFRASTTRSCRCMPAA